MYFVWYTRFTNKKAAYQNNTNTSADIGVSIIIVSGSKDLFFPIEQRKNGNPYVSLEWNRFVCIRPHFLDTGFTTNDNNKISRPRQKIPHCSLNILGLIFTRHRFFLSRDTDYQILKICLITVWLKVVTMESRKNVYFFPEVEDWLLQQIVK